MQLTELGRVSVCMPCVVLDGRLGVVLFVLATGCAKTSNSSTPESPPATPIQTVEVQASTPKVEACVKKSVKGASAAFGGTCAATFSIGG